jgi:hypothetical protein
MLSVFLYKFVQPSDLSSVKPATAAKSNRTKPEFRDTVITFNMNVRRFTTITRIEEESERFNPQYGRHRSPVPSSLRVPRISQRPWIFSTNSGAACQTGESVVQHTHSPSASSWRRAPADEDHD